MQNLGKVVFLGAVVLASQTLGCGKLFGKGGDDGGAGSSGGGLFGLKKDDALSFLSSFEGEIGVMIKAPPGRAAKGMPETMNIALLVKDKKFRADIPQFAGPTGAQVKGFLVVDGTDKKAFAVMDTPEKMAIVFDLNKTGEQLKSFGGGPKAFGQPQAQREEKKPPKVTKTGHKDKVAGYECEDWQIENADPNEGGKATMCVAQQGFSWLQIPMMGAPAEYAWAGELLDGTHFPLRFVGYEKDGKEAGRVEVTKIEKKTLAADQFVVPPGYPQMTLDQMFAKMMSGMRIGAGAGGPPGGVQLPPGVTLPPGVQLPPGVSPAPGTRPKGHR